MITLKQLKSFLYISPDETSKDQLLAGFIKNAVSGMGSLCARNFEHSAYTEIYSGTGGTTLVLENYPVSAVSKLEAYNGESWEDVFTPPDTFTSCGLLLKEIGIIKLLRSYIFLKGEHNVRVTYSAGYKYADEWLPGQHYSSGNTARYNNIIYFCLEDHTSAAEFDETKWSADTAKAVPESLAQAVMYMAAKQFYESPSGRNLLMKSSEIAGDKQTNYKDIDIERVIHTFRNTNVS